LVISGLQRRCHVAAFSFDTRFNTFMGLYGA